MSRNLRSIMESKQTVKHNNVHSKVEKQKTLSMKSSSQDDSCISSNYDSAIDCGFKSSEISASNITPSQHLSSHSLSDQPSKIDQNSQFDSGLGSDYSSTLSENVETEETVEETVKTPELPRKKEKLRWRDIYYQDDDGDTLLHLAIIETLSDVLFPIIRLAPHPDFLDITNKLDQTPLHLATLTKKFTIARRLVVAGATLDIKDHGGNIPLHIACKSGDLDCVKALLTPITQSEIDEANCVYQTFIRGNNLSYLINMKNFEGLSSMHLAAAGGWKKVLKFLFSNDADVNERDGKSGRTALHYAVENEDLKLVELLLIQGNANPLVPNYAGKTAHSIACSLRKRNPSKIRQDISDLLGKYAEKFDSASEFESDSSIDESDYNEALEMIRQLSVKK